MKWRLFALLLCSCAALLQADTFTVTTIDDNGDDAQPTPGSLREAILQANALNGPSTIQFTATGIIQPPKDLPDLEQPITIDGYLGAPGGAKPNDAPIHEANNAVITVEIRGVGPGYMQPGPIWGLCLEAPGCIVRGIAISNFAATNDSGIFGLGGGVGLLIGVEHCKVEGCFIGTDTTGTLSLPNMYGVLIQDDHNTIGGHDPGARNLLAGEFNRQGTIANVGNGIVIEGNTIGLDVTGKRVLCPGQQIGISHLFVTDVTIKNNIIAGYGSANVLCTAVDKLVIAGNTIGADLAPSGVGIALSNDNLAYPTSVQIFDNQISGNTYGIKLGENSYSDFPYVGVQIFRNVIGKSELDGIWLKFAQDTYIEGNTISENGRHGVRINKASHSIMTGNKILKNGGDGIRIGSSGVGLQAFGDVIGSAKSKDGNVISYNKGNGIKMVSYVENEVIIGNEITHNGGMGLDQGLFSSNNSLGTFPSRGRMLIIGELSLSNTISDNGKP